MTVVQVGDRTLTITNETKVLYQETGFTKGDVMGYYATVAPAILPHLHGRALTRKRFPDGSHTAGFFEKRCPDHRPEWLEVAVGPGDRDGLIHYCCINDVAALVWAGNMAALELHAPMALAADLDTPLALVFDFDPGAPAAMRECAQAALDVAEVLDAAKLKGFCKTSGSKGMQMYVPLNRPCTHEHASAVALAIGQVLERKDPARYLTNMTKAKRDGKVFIDWSQNSRHKTTIAPYSLRARPRPTVSTPVSWDEVEGAARGATDLVFEATDVMARVVELGDLFADVLTLVQTLPGQS
jgi:bifunctional non-homologous end joining protein LigD